MFRFLLLAASEVLKEELNHSLIWTLSLGKLVKNAHGFNFEVLGVLCHSFTFDLVFLGGWLALKEPHSLLWLSILDEEVVLDRLVEEYFLGSLAVLVLDISDKIEIGIDLISLFLRFQFFPLWFHLCMHFIKEQVVLGWSVGLCKHDHRVLHLELLQLGKWRYVRE